MAAKRRLTLAIALARASTLAFALAPTLAGAAVPDAEMQQAVQAAQAAVGQQDCGGALRALDPLVPRLDEGPQRAVVQRMRLVCLGVEGRAGDIPTVQRELAKSMPRDGVVQAFGVLVAADESRFTDAASQIEALAANSPRNLEILTGASIRAIVVRLSEQRAYGERGRMLVALARADFQPTDIPELRVSFAQGAIESLVKSGQTDEAAELLDRIDQPELLSGMAIERQYVSLWPAIETRLGTNGAAQADRFAKDRLNIFANAPDSMAARRDAVVAMLMLGRYDDADAIARDVSVHEGMDRDEVRIVLARVRALAVLGRIDEATALLAQFAGLDVRKTPEASPALISYAEFLDEQGQEQKALDVARAAQAGSAAYLTDFGKRWLDRTEVCALSALGRTVEAGEAMERLLKLSAQNEPATIEALLCVKRDAEAAKMAVKGFDDEDVAGNLVMQFQPQGSLWAPSPSRLRLLWESFLTRPEVKAAFERKGRVLPRKLWPLPTPRAVPRSGGSNLT
jgi:tetratricopeptide (TPR) repeat protein